ncbi:MAG: alpha/beta fold hydrolase [Desulfovibrio sp.]|nr:alpha/beta fold hydrolase [Desulfovibrio sp.]
MAQNGLFFQGGRVGVLLIHGLTGTPAEMSSVAKYLNRYGFTVSCPVLAGHCGTEQDLLATHWQDWAGSVRDAFLVLRQQTKTLFVGGLSAGAVLSLHMAKEYADLVRGVALYSTTLRWDGWSIPRLSFLLPLVLRLPYFGERYHFVEDFPYGIKNKRLRERIVAKMRSGDTSAAGHAHTPGTCVREMWRMVDAIKKDFGEIHTPALIVHAADDDIASLRSNALYLQRRLAGPTELLCLKESYHMVTADQERHKVADATAQFFLRLLDDQERNELAAAAKRVS